MATLRDLGLSEYESRVYRSLLEMGPTTAKELSDRSDVPMGRIYDVLNGLETRNLIRSQTASRPKKYVAVEADTALDRLLETKREELEQKVSQYEEIASELKTNLERADPVDEPFWTAALGEQEAADLLVERIATADERIVLVTATTALYMDLDTVGERIVDELEDAIERGVSVSVLMDPDVVDGLPQSVGRRYRYHLQNHRNFEVRVGANLTATSASIDGTELCLEVPHPTDAAELFGVINLKDPGFVANVREAVDSSWEQADRLEL